MAMRERIITAVCTLTTFSVLLLTWHWLATAMSLDNVLPTPGRVLQALDRGLRKGIMLADVRATVHATAMGLLYGVGAGLAAALLFSSSPVLERTFLPVVTGIQSIPKVAFAPLIVAYVGYGAESKIFTVALFSFFPCLINAFVALRNADPQLLEMHRCFGGSGFRSYLEIRVPHALPAVFAGIQVAVSLALTGAVTAEFVAATEGLGNVIKTAASSMDASVMFAAIFILSAIGAAATCSVQILQSWAEHRFPSGN